MPGRWSTRCCSTAVDSLAGLQWGAERPGVVHRIDKDTSGLLVCAKDDESYLGLSSQIQQHTVDRFYETVVYGKVKQEEGVIDLPIGAQS